MQAILFTLIPVLAVLAGAVVALIRRPGAAFVSAMQHLAAGVVFAAAATEILPQIKHDASPVATLIGGIAGVAAMLLLKELEGRARGPVAMLGAVGIDILVDGLVLGLAFVGFMSPLCDLLGITKETRAKSGLTFSAINVVYMTVVFLLVEALLPGLFTMASIWSGVIAAVGFNVLLALTLPRSSQSAG